MAGEEKKEGPGAEDENGAEAPSPSKDDDVHWGAQVAQCLLTAAPSTVDLVGGPGKLAAVHHAVIRNDVAFIEALVKFKADLDVKDGAGRAPVVIAAYEGYNECLELLLKAGASVDAVFPGPRKEPLVCHFARRGLAKSVILCIRYDAKDVPDAEGMTARSLAERMVGKGAPSRETKVDAKGFLAPVEKKVVGFAKCAEVLANAGWKTSADIDAEGIRVGEEGEEKDGEEKDGEEEKHMEGEGEEQEKKPSGFFGSLFGRRGKKGRAAAKEGVKEEKEVEVEKEEEKEEKEEVKEEEEKEERE